MTETAAPSDASAIDLVDDARNLRRERPVSREEDGPWQVVRDPHVQEVLRNHEVFSPDVAVRLEEDTDHAPRRDHAGRLRYQPPEWIRLPGGIAAEIRRAAQAWTAPRQWSTSGVRRSDSVNCEGQP